MLLIFNSKAFINLDSKNMPYINLGRAQMKPAYCSLPGVALTLVGRKSLSGHLDGTRGEKACKLEVEKSE